MTFKPIKRVNRSIHQVGLTLDTATYERAKKIAAEHGVALKELARQALDYALDNIDTSDSDNRKGTP